MRLLMPRSQCARKGGSCSLFKEAKGSSSNPSDTQCCRSSSNRWFPGSLTTGGVTKATVVIREQPRGWEISKASRSYMILLCRRVGKGPLDILNVPRCGVGICIIMFAGIGAWLAVRRVSMWFGSWYLHYYACEHRCVERPLDAVGAWSVGNLSEILYDSPFCMCNQQTSKETRRRDLI